LDYKSGHREHIFYKYWLASKPEGATLKGYDHTDKNDTALLNTYRPEEISDEYIIRVAGQYFIVVNHPSKVYGLPDAHEYIDGNLPLYLVLDIDTRQKLDPMNPELLSLDRSKISHLRGFVEKVTDRIEKPYSEFIDIGLYKSHFSLRLFGSAKKDR
ncbi:36032_t:CDS:2, partial [Racocetra persica]